MAETILEVKDFGIEFHDHDSAFPPPETMVSINISIHLPNLEI